MTHDEAMKQPKKTLLAQWGTFAGWFVSLCIMGAGMLVAYGLLVRAWKFAAAS